MTHSDYFRFRTGATGLSDGELLLLDRLFNGIWYPIRFLYEESLAFDMGFPCSHGFSDEKVRALMARWCEWGWLEYDEGDRDGPHYALTPLGGAQWERERQPIWKRYCTDSQFRGRPGCARSRRQQGELLVSITSPSRRTAEDFFRTSKRSRMFEGTIIGRSRTTRVLRGWSEPGWKGFPRMIEIQAALRDTESMHGTDWNRYERERTWWRFARELVELRLQVLLR